MKTLLISLLLASTALRAESPPVFAPTVPDTARPLVKEAKDDYDRGNLREAEMCYERALLKAPDNVFLLSNLGVIRFRLGKLKEAEKVFERATAVAPTDAFSRLSLAVLYYNEARYDDALDQLRSVSPDSQAKEDLLKMIDQDKTKYPSGDYPFLGYPVSDDPIFERKITPRAKESGATFSYASWLCTKS